MIKSIESKQKINYFSRNREMFDNDFKYYTNASQRVLGKSNILRSFCGVFVYKIMKFSKNIRRCPNCNRVFGSSTTKDIFDKQYKIKEK